MPVYYRCKACGKEHLSPIGFGDKKSFETTRLEANSFQCPETHRSDSYDKKDMYWKDK